MKRTRIFMAFLLIAALLTFVGCSNDNGTDMDPGTNGTDNGIVDDNTKDGSPNGINGTEHVTGGGVDNNVTY